MQNIIAKYSGQSVVAKHKVNVGAIKAYGMIPIIPTNDTMDSRPYNDNIPYVQNNAHDPRSFALPIQMPRIKIDVFAWRDSISEAEDAYYPHRYKMQQMFVDKILEGHIYACMEKIKNLTLLKQFKIGKKDGDNKWVENEKATKLFTDKQWFGEMCGHILDARFYGYSLIQLGDLVNVKGDWNFKGLTLLKRWLVSPDRYNYNQIPYQITGLNFLDDREVDDNGVSFSDWMLYIDTPTDTAASICGYGILYNVALYGITLRNNLSHNADYTQMFAAPYRHIKTPAKFGSDEYNELEESAANMGANGYVITSDQEEIIFTGGNAGAGYQSYDNLEKRCEAKISKIILGHANGMDAQSTALGGGAGGRDVDQLDNSPEGKALLIKEKLQDKYALECLNGKVLPKLRNLGFPVPEDEGFYFPNDKEEMEKRQRNDSANKATAEVYKIAKDAGLDLDPEEFQNVTGIKTERVEVDEPEVQEKESIKKLQAKMVGVYTHKH